MYFVKYGDKYLHDPRVEGYCLFDISFDCEENSCGFCDFTMHSNHPMYGKIRERDSENPIEVYDGDELLFAGFIYELGNDFYLDGLVKCKGELDYLNESLIRPYSTVQRGYGLKAPDSPGKYFAWLIEQHNSQVKPDRQFKIGINQGSTLSTMLFRENDKYPKTIEEISEVLLNNSNIGGYIRLRHENGIRYIDYISEWTDMNTQILDFGVNLTDYTGTDDSSEICTYVVPIGAKMSETDYDYNDGYFRTSDSTPNPYKEYYTWNEDGYSKCNDLTAFESGVRYYEYDENNDESNLPLTVDGYLNGTGNKDFTIDGDKIYSFSAVQKYGWIPLKYENQDLIDKKDLVEYGITALKEKLSPKRTIEIKAVDMHLVNPEIKPIKVGEYVRVRSKPHNLDSYFLCRNISLDLNNPENSVYTLGTTFDTLTGQQNKRINSLNSSVNQSVDVAKSIGEQAKNNASNASATATEAKKQSDSAVEIAQQTKDTTVIAIVEEYAVSLTPTDKPTNGWTTNTPDYESNTFIWRRIVTTYGNGKRVIGSPVLVTGNNGQNGEDAVLLRIDSSRGTVFENNSVSTVLSAIIFKGSKQISTINQLHEEFGSDAYLQWYCQKINESSFVVISSSDPKIGQNGFTLTITADDVDTKATFKCELIV